MGESAPCHRSKNKAFINPYGAHDRSIRAAQKMCSQCPVIRECALEALRSGSTLDDSIVTLGREVIAAGHVLPKGDASNDDVWPVARKLAKIARVRPPAYVVSRPRFRPPSQCRECGRPMVPWTRGEVPEGMAMHYAQGWGQCCRSAYRMHREVREVPVTRKPVDRKRHHPETARARAATAARRATNCLRTSELSTATGGEDRSGATGAGG
ncbi:Transcription factor WhiB [Corynebacterium atrinae]|uniref:WhiB family transcriptional regulator n=1 Tax=Corynebacterium atrinae TaxID=1336740 RepID=UPI00338EB86C|nr:Transcription factor WhiB [Corynebacterium atrinae]